MGLGAYSEGISRGERLFHGHGREVLFRRL